MIRLHPIKNQASPYWDSLVRIYRESFPIDEQRPLESMAHLIADEPRYTMYAIVDTDGQRLKAMSESQELRIDSQRPIGLLTTWEFADFIYIEPFAIAPTLRSQGYGSEALKAFIKEHSTPLILEAEPPTDALSIRRIKFYERCGFTLHNYPYMQPAYTKESHPVELRLMGTLATEATPLTRVTQILHHEVYKCDLTPRP